MMLPVKSRKIQRINSRSLNKGSRLSSFWDLYRKRNVLGVLLMCMAITFTFHFVLLYRYFFVDMYVQLIDVSSTWNLKSSSRFISSWLNTDSTSAAALPRFSYVGYNESSIFSRIFQFDEVVSGTEADFELTSANFMCFREGTDKTTGHESNVRNCTCKSTWYGPSCSIPGIVQRSATPWSKDGLSVRNTSRRIVHAFPFNIEFDMLDLRLAELGDVVDVFLILESNYTAYGTWKRLHLLERLLSGMYNDYHCKIVYVLLDFFPSEARKDGWIADGLHRNHLGTHGLPRIRGLRTDDLFILTDADEIPCREALNFLKWHDGYSEPVLIKYERYVYGFFWGPHAPDGSFTFNELPTVVTIGMVTYIFRNQVYFIRNSLSFIANHDLDVKVYMEMFPSRRINKWTLGSGARDVAGWHCSWCLDADGIRVKLISAQNGDFPRWGDYPEKCDINYIKRLVATGTWFDDVSKMKRRDHVAGPPSLMANYEKYKHLLVNIYYEELMGNQTTAKMAIVGPIVVNSTTTLSSVPENNETHVIITPITKSWPSPQMTEYRTKPLK